MRRAGKRRQRKQAEHAEMVTAASMRPAAPPATDTPLSALRAARTPMADGTLSQNLAALMAGGEGQRVEFKRELPKERRLVRLLAGMANAGGGVVLFGVDDRGRVVGVPDPTALERDVRALAAAQLDPIPVLSAKVLSASGMSVVAVTVAPPIGGLVSELWGSGRLPAIRVNDHVQPGERLSLGADLRSLPHDRRLGMVPAETRARYLKVERATSRASLQRFHAAEYARACNVSARTARRDVVLLSRVFLVWEVEEGLYEIIRA